MKICKGKEWDYCFHFLYVILKGNIFLYVGIVVGSGTLEERSK